MKTALASALPGFVNEDGDIVPHTHQWAVDWGVQVVQSPAVYDEELNIVTPAVLEAGFFANVCVLDDSLDVSALNALDQTPANPQRVFA